MASSLALKRLLSSKFDILLRPMAVGPSATRLFHTDTGRDLADDRSGGRSLPRRGDGFFSDLFDPLSRTRKLSQDLRGYTSMTASPTDLKNGVLKAVAPEINEEEKKDAIQEQKTDDLIGRGSPNKNILRPLSPHLPIYQPQLNSTISITNRISGVYLSTFVLFSYLLSLKMGSICFTYSNFYQFFFYSSKLLLISSEIAALALAYHVFYGVRHLLNDLLGLGK